MTTLKNETASHEIVFATQNEHKVREVQRLMPAHIKLLSLKDIGCTEDIPEEEDSIEGNAAAKAEWVYQRYKRPCFADDTGLEVKALNGAPGVYSARYAGEAKSASANMEKLLGELEGVKDRAARFKTVIALRLPQEKTMFQGIVNGYITEAPKGEGGFGYDPVFRPEGYNETFAELPLEVKNTIGHRGKAIAQLIEYLSL